MPTQIAAMPRQAGTSPTLPTPGSLDICILAGGKSSRLGRDKSKLRLGNRTLVGWLRHRAAGLGKVRVIRRDDVPACGPLGGVYTALRRSGAERVLFLSCDMPFISGQLMRRLITISRRSPAVFTGLSERAGFPFILQRQSALPIVARQLQEGEFALSQLFRRLGARAWHPPRRLAAQLLNINTAKDWERAQATFEQRL